MDVTQWKGSFMFKMHGTSQLSSPGQYVWTIITKDVFFSESAINFSSLKKNIPKKLSYTLNLNFLPITPYRYWWEI